MEKINFIRPPYFLIDLCYNDSVDLSAAGPFCPKLAWIGKTDSVGNVVTGGGAAVDVARKI